MRNGSPASTRLDIAQLAQGAASPPGATEGTAAILEG